MPSFATAFDPRAQGRARRRWLSSGVLLAHVLCAWALLQSSLVRDAVKQAAPTLLVRLIAAPDSQPSAPATPVAPATPLTPPPVAPLPVPATPSRQEALAAAQPVTHTAPVDPTPAVAATPAPAPAPTPAPMAAVPPPPVHEAPPPAAPTTPPAAKKIPGSALRYLALPRLNFPLLSRRANESGEVVLRIVVDASGRLKDAWVHKSSGYARLDQAALQDIRSARFAPYTEDGKAVEVESIATLAYDLDR